MVSTYNTETWAKDYKVVECDAQTGEVIGVREFGSRKHCVDYLSRASKRPANQHFTLELRHPDGRIVSWRS